MGGAAEATVIAQAVSGIGIAGYTILKVPFLRLKKEHMHMERETLNRVVQYSMLTCAQQSVMNFGILMIQGLVNSFGTVIMAAFAVAVKIDTLAYMLPRNLEMRFLFLFLRITEQKDTTGFGRLPGLL